MKPAAWLVQTNLHPASPTPALLRQACEHQGKPCLPFPVLPHSPALPALAQAVRGGPVVFHGRSTLIQLALASPWRHGVFFDRQTFRHQAYAEGFGERLLNAGAEVMTWEQLLDRARHASGRCFLKPHDDHKGFTGQALDLTQAGTLFDSLSAPSAPARAHLLQSEVVVAPVYEVDAEWRLFVVDGVIVSGSMYRPTGDAHLPVGLLDFARAAIRDWTPAPVFVLDVGRVERQWKIIECNCFNASRLFEANAQAIVQTVSEYQEGRYPDLPLDQRAGMA